MNAHLNDGGHRPTRAGQRSRAKTALVTVACAALSAVAVAQPALATTPGENDLIAFNAITGSGVQIYTVRPDGHDLRQLTHVPGEASHADWSPDGRTIAFDVGTEDSDQVALMDRDGSHFRIIPASPGGLEGDPSFTPDGKNLVFERYEPDTNDDAIWIMALDGTHRRRITTGLGATDPNVSPDGKTLTVVAFNGVDYGQALVRMRLDGSHQEQLTSYGLDVAVKHDWAPDRHSILLSDNADVPGASANVATIRPNGSGLSYLTHYTGGELKAYAGSFSPDGKWIVYRLEDHGLYALMRMHPDGTDVQTILPLSTFRPRGNDWGSSPQDSQDHEQ